MSDRKNIKNYICAAIAVIIITAMAAAAEAFGSKEIIFPEIAAICLGAFIAPRLAWNTSKLRMLVCIAVCALFGYIISAFLPVTIYFKLLTAFIIGTVVLVLSETGFVPMLSAIILPVVIKTDSIIYPVSATLLTMSVTVILYLLEKTGIREKRAFIPQKTDIKNSYTILLKRFAVYSVLSFISVQTGFLIALAPPLVVAFTELSNVSCPARKIPLKICLLISLSAFTGEAVRYAICQTMGFSLFAGVFISVIAVIAVLMLAKVYMPPILAITVLAFLPNEVNIPLYTLQITAGFSVLMICALLFFNDKINDK